MHKILNIAKPNLKLQQRLSRELKISGILAQLLINRGITSPEKGYNFLNPRLSQLLSPENLPDIQKACARIKKAVTKKEKIMIFGDYDVDGLTGTALLSSLFKRFHLEVINYLPHRVDEGYGLNKKAIKKAKDEDVGLLVTVDCGTSSFEEIEELKRSKIDTIVTDHHQPIIEKNESSPALALINPKRKDSSYAYKELSGVAVAYKFAQKITAQFLEDDLDLVCLGTIADVVPLTGENRIIARKGLEFLPHSKKIGIHALIKQSRIKSGPMNTASVSFILAPRINASGRIDSAEISLKLLLTDSPDEAEELSRQLCAFNYQRQRIGDKMLREAQDMIQREVNFKEHKVIVVAGDGWHHGVLGIAAARIKDLFYRPTVVISIGEDLCKGSARSINNFHILDALKECNHTLRRFGGHRRAAGLALDKDKIESFKERLNQIAKERLVLEDLYPALDIDLELKLGDLREGLIEEIQLLEPFGEANAEPVFYTRNLRLKAKPQVLNKGVLRFWVTDGEFTYKAVGFDLAGLEKRIEDAQFFDIAYTLRMDKWSSPHALELRIRDIQLS